MTKFFHQNFPGWFDVRINQDESSYLQLIAFDHHLVNNLTYNLKLIFILKELD